MTTGRADPACGGVIRSLQRISTSDDIPTPLPGRRSLPQGLVFGVDFEPLDQIVAFVPATNLDASREFYGDLLGLEIVSVDDYAIAIRSGGSNLRIAKVDTLSPQPFTVLGWNVNNIVGAMTFLAERGVEFLRFDGMEQDGVGVWKAPSGALVSWFHDPDGNMLSLTQLG